MAQYILKRDVARGYYWILRSTKNYKTIAMSSEAYRSKQEAIDSIGWTRVNGGGADFKDES